MTYKEYEDSIAAIVADPEKAADNAIAFLAKVKEDCDAAEASAQKIGTLEGQLKEARYNRFQAALGNQPEEPKEETIEDKIAAFKAALNKKEE